MDCLEWILRCGLATLTDQQLTESPAHEPLVGVKSIEAFFGVQGQQLLQDLGSLSAGPGEDGVQESEDRGKGVGLVKRQQPAPHLAAAGADGQQMEELLVLPGSPVDRQQMLQGGGIKMPVLHAILLVELL
jgi:hypothetical protein